MLNSPTTPTSSTSTREPRSGVGGQDQSTSPMAHSTEVDLAIDPSLPPLPGDLSGMALVVLTKELTTEQLDKLTARAAKRCRFGHTASVTLAIGRDAMTEGARS